MPFRLLIVAQTEPLRDHYRRLVYNGMAKLEEQIAGGSDANVRIDLRSVTSAALGAPAYDAVLYDGGMTPRYRESAVERGRANDAFLRLRMVLPPRVELTIVELLEPGE
jgi:hypothetical protein